MTLSEAIGQVFGDVRSIVVDAAKEAGVQLDESTIDQLTTATQQALRNELETFESEQAFNASVQQMIAKETRRFMLRVGMKPNNQVL